MDTDEDVLARLRLAIWCNSACSAADYVLYKDRNKAEPAQAVQTLNAAKGKRFSAIFVLFRGLTLGWAALIRPPVPSNGPEFAPGERRTRLSLPDEQ